ncbi:MAG: hypothetical protein NT123_26265 [Proteobacteria bacterium]|nr:hypothetical protein [Pseudomonadota bacterium]
MLATTSASGARPLKSRNSTRNITFWRSRRNARFSAPSSPTGCASRNVRMAPASNGCSIAAHAAWNISGRAWARRWA